MSVGWGLALWRRLTYIRRCMSSTPTAHPKRIMVPNASTLVRAETNAHPSAPNERVCGAPGGCDRPVLARGLCKYHYYKERDAARREAARNAGQTGRASAVPTPGAPPSPAPARPAGLDTEIEAHLRRVAAAAGISVADLQRRIISDWYRRSLSAVVPAGE